MDRSPFGSLPPELRVEIYKLVLIQDHDIQLIDRGGEVICGNTFDGQRRHNVLAITATCKLVREESLPVFHGCNGFFLNTKPDITRTGRAWIRRYLRGQNTLDTFQVWLSRIGRLARISIRHLTFDLGFWSTLPISVDVQEKWWLAAQRGARLLRDAGLGSACDIRLHVPVQHFALDELWGCWAYGPRLAIHESLELVFCVKSGKEAIAEITRTICAQVGRLMLHEDQESCSLGEWGSLELEIFDLLFSYFMILRAFGWEQEHRILAVCSLWPREHPLRVDFIARLRDFEASYHG